MRSIRGMCLCLSAVSPSFPWKNVSTVLEAPGQQQGRSFVAMACRRRAAVTDVPCGACCCSFLTFREIERSTYTVFRMVRMPFSQEDGETRCGRSRRCRREDTHWGRGTLPRSPPVLSACLFLMQGRGAQGRHGRNSFPRQEKDCCLRTKAFGQGTLWSLFHFFQYIHRDTNVMHMVSPPGCSPCFLKKTGSCFQEPFIA